MSTPDTTEPPQSQDSTDDAPAAGESDTPHFAGTIPTAALEVAFDAVGAASTSQTAESRWQFAPAGVTATVLDPANVLMVRVRVPHDTWDEYTGAHLGLGVKHDKLANLARGDTTTIEWDTTDFRLAVESGPVSAKMSAIDPDEVRSMTPNTNTVKGVRAAWEMPATDFITAHSVLSDIHGGAIRAVADPADDGLLGFRTEGDTDDVDVAFAEAEWLWSSGDRVTSRHDAGYIKEIKQALPRDATIRCATGTNWPLIVDYVHEGVEVMLVNSPRIDDL